MFEKYQISGIEPQNFVLLCLLIVLKRRDISKRKGKYTQKESKKRESF